MNSYQTKLNFEQLLLEFIDSSDSYTLLQIFENIDEDEIANTCKRYNTSYNFFQKIDEIIYSLIF